MNLNFEPINVASLPFVSLLLLVAVAARHASGARFAVGLFATGALLLATWLDFGRLMLLAASLLPFTFYVHAKWGKKQSNLVLGSMISFQVLCLLASKITPFSTDWGLAGTVGLSYLTFRQIHLLIALETLSPPFRREIFLSYLINPWTLFAGPIQNFAAFEKGLRTMAAPDFNEKLQGLSRMATGLLKVLVFAPFIQQKFSLETLTPDSNALMRLLVFYSFYAFVYLEFSGYVDLVIGAARLAGYRALPENFDKPFAAANLQEFWQRWHITLGAWFRFHVFNPLVASQMRRNVPEAAAVSLALFTIFVLIGLWHGFEWNYFYFGLIHAIGVVFVYLMRGPKVVEKSSLRPLRVFICQHVVAASFVVFANPVSSISKLWAGWLS